MDAKEKSDRLVEAAAALLRAAPQQCLKIVLLNKALFYLDLCLLRDRGKTLTGNAYIAIQQGPVVANYPERLVKQLTVRGIARQTGEWDGSKPVVLEVEPSYIHVDAAALEQAAMIATYFGALTSTKASDFSHENPGWQVAWADYQRLGKPCAIDMQIALQQIIEDDPWMDEPMLEDDEVLRMADAEHGVEW